MATYKKNDELVIKIEDCTADGAGVGHADGMAVFVAGTAVGDTVRCRIIKVKSNYLIGKSMELTQASPHRCEPGCSVFGRCGGCVYRHITYEAELSLKQKRVEDALSRIGGLDVIVEPIKGAQSVQRYRNKAQYPLSVRDVKVFTGFFAEHSHRVIPVEDCPLQPEEFSRLADVFTDFVQSKGISVFDGETGRGLVRHLYLRKAFATGEIMVCPVINGKKLPDADELVKRLISCEPNVKTVVLNINTDITNVILGTHCVTLYGDGYITDILCGLRFTLSPLSFYQVNSAQTQVLYGIVKQLAAVKKDETVLDLYCGTGTIGLTLAADTGKLIGVEQVPQAIENARLNAARNGIKNAEFICADAAAAAHELHGRGIKPGVIILDPPRKGCDADMPATVAAMQPERIVYVSCDPATLARDCKLFFEYGYRVITAVPVDMFPRTKHVETVCLLTKLRSE